jgi:hypothetical protein
MTTVEQDFDQPLPTRTSSGERWRLFGLVGLTVLVVVLDASVVGRWMAIHTGTDDLLGPWYGFWSGFGSDLAELGLIGAVATGVYQIVRKHNYQEPRCRRVGTRRGPAASSSCITGTIPTSRGSGPTGPEPLKPDPFVFQIEAAAHVLFELAHDLSGSEPSELGIRSCDVAGERTHQLEILFDPSLDTIVQDRHDNIRAPVERRRVHLDDGA